MATTALVVVACLGPGVPRAHAQGAFGAGLTSTDTEADGQMLLNADELIYDRDEDTITARGSVQIYYKDNVLLADSVTMYRKTGRFVARGNVRLDDPAGNVLFTDEAELTDDFAEGFLTAMRMQSALETRFAAESAERTAGNRTVFNKGVYNACRYCVTEGRRRPTWQIKAAKIIHNQKEKLVSYRNARLEFLGLPIFYTPYFSHPDPTLRRKTGLLAPGFVYGDDIGYGARIPYFVNVAPNMDVTLSATPLSRQGVLLDGQWRHKVVSGEYSVSVAGIRQAHPEDFGTTSGNRDVRGAITTSGHFTLNQYWNWGFSATATTDRSFLADYRAYQSISASTEAFVHLTGIKEKNYFDIRALGFLIQQEDGSAPFSNNLQERQPIVHPVLDYSTVFDNTFLGGELSFAANVTSLTRGFEDRDSFGRILGPEGNFARTSAEVQWRRRYVDPIGQSFTPFAYLRADAFAMDDQSSIKTAVFADGRSATLTDDEFAGRVMPAVGLQYSYPFISGHSWGNQVIEPVGQIIARPSEQEVGALPNEDAQSLIFDDSLLFDLDKYSGFDRSEGGTRANIGVKYSLQFVNGARLSTLVGRSFHLAGRNSFAETDVVKSAIGSGLDVDHSDYVSRIYLDSGTGLQVGARARFGGQDFEMNRVEIQGVGQLGPALGSLTYAFVNENDEAGITQDLTEIQGAGTIRITRAFRAFGAVRYDLENATIVRNSVGLGYDYDDLSLSVAFSEDRSRNSSELVDRTVFVRFGLRTLGSSTLSQSVLPAESD